MQPVETSRAGEAKKFSLWICVALALVTFAVFWPVTKSEFVNFDDTDFITANPQVQSGLNAKSIAWAFNLKTEVARNWHPITMLSHMLDVEIWKLNSGGHHFDNLLWHVANTLLLFLLLRKMTGAIWRSAFVAALFALHPLHVESVAWMAERKDVLSTFFWLLTTWFYVRYAESSKLKASEHSTFNIQRPTFNYTLALVFFALGLMSKPMLVTLPFTLLLLDFWPLKRFSKIQNPKSKSQPAAQLRALDFGLWTRLVVEKIPFFILSAILCAITFSIQKTGGAMLNMDNLSLGSRVSNALISYVRYLGKMVWPENLAGLYLRIGGWPMNLVVLAAIFLIAVSIAAFVLACKRPYFFVGWFWFFGTLAPVIGVVQVGMQAMADRYTYVPLIGIFIALAWGACDLAAAWKLPKISLRIAGAGALAACAIMTSLTLPHWKNSEALFTRMITATDKNYMAHYNLANFYWRGKNFDKAIENYEAALRDLPNYANAHNNLAGVFLDLHRYDEAIAHYKEAARINAEPIHFFNLANAYLDAGRHAEAIASYHEALRVDPNYSSARTNLAVAELHFANALSGEGKLDEASAHYSEAQRAGANPAECYNGMGIGYAMQNKFAEAAAQFEKTLQLNPDDGAAHSNLANALAAQNKFVEAGPHYLAALKINPQDFQTHFNLAVTLLRQGKRDEAKEHYVEALRLKPDYAEAKRGLEALSSPAATK